jgi:TPP-dependent pyruvate/acetoin dehydrogenase alpha subunit
MGSEVKVPSDGSTGRSNAEGDLSTEDLLEDFRQMHRIREFEERAMQLYRDGFMPGLVHAYSGQEAVAIGVSAHLRRDDTITSTHRGHGHCIAKGVDMTAMMAENMGRLDGVCRGMGGSMHVADVSLGILGANGIVAGGVGIATGAAFSFKTQGLDRVSVCFVGDGSMNQGVVYETMNIAALWKLPLIYVCEYNGFTEYTRSEELIAGDLSARAEAFGVRALEVDGMDVAAVREAAADAISHARSGGGPSMILAYTHRYYGHHVAEFDSAYRLDGELEDWRLKDPIVLLAKELERRGVSSEDLASIAKEVVAELDEVVSGALASPTPPAEQTFSFVYAGTEGEQ